MLSNKHLEQLIEAAIFSSTKPVSIKKLKTTLLAQYQVSTKDIQTTIDRLIDFYKARGVNLVQLASGYQFQIKAEHNSDIILLTEDKPQKYSRAFLETLALIAYKQPITRGEIEDVRGVAVSSHIIKTLLEREWIKVIGQKEVPGKPSMYGTTKAFLDYFSLKSLAQLPDLLPIVESSIAEGAMQDIIPKNESSAHPLETATKQEE